MVAMVLVVPMLGGESSGFGELAWALARAVGVVVAVLVVARTVTPRLLDAVARTCSAEIFLLSVVALCFGTAYLTSLLDVSVSLGAFLAGLMVSESRLSSQALGEVMPLQILFSATFFVSMGMLLDLEYLIDELPLVLGLAVAIVGIKLLTTGIAAAVLRQPRSVVVGSALVLAQVGEFSFVLERAGEDVGLVPAGLDQGSEAFIAITVLLMVLSPFGIRLSETVSTRLAARDGVPGRWADVEMPIHGHSDLADHVVIVGYGERGRQLAPALELADLPYVITTLDPDAGRLAADEGRPVIAGDVLRSFVAERAGLGSARLVVIADDDPERTLQVAEVVWGLNPGAVVLARVATVDQAAVVQAHLAVDHVVADEGATMDAIIGHVLGTFALPERLVEVVTQTTLGTLTEADEGGLLDDDQLIHSRIDGDGCGHVASVRVVRPSARGCERCLAEGGRWVQLRVCLGCGHVGCCDSSPHRHARAHYNESGHPIMRSIDPDEGWAYCFVDRQTFALVDSEEDWLKPGGWEVRP